MNGHLTFKGYYRSDGSVGTANYWIVIPMVFCENRNVNVMREAMLEQLGFHEHNKYSGFAHLLKELYLNGKSVGEIADINVESYVRNKKSSVFTNIDGIAFLTHQGGCGGTRQDANALCGLLAGYVTNANVAGATVLSLGCQNAQVEILLNEIKKRDPAFSKPLYVLDQQQTGIETDLITSAIRQTFYGLIKVDSHSSRSAPLSKLCIGIESNTTNVAVNAVAASVSDILIDCGATVILSRASRLKSVADKLRGRFKDEKEEAYFGELAEKYEHLFSQQGAYLQKEGHESAEKRYAAGQLIASGNALIASILDYPEKVTRQGLNLLFTSDDNIEIATALTGSGATIILSASDSVIENPIASVIKISDYLDGNTTVEAAAERIMDMICNLSAVGIKERALAMQDDFIPWKRGISL